MADTTRQPKREEPKKRNVPIAVTHEGFWCCPSHATLQKTTIQKKHSSSFEKKKALSVQPKSDSFPLEKEGSCAPGVVQEVDTSRRRITVEEMVKKKKKMTVEFGDPDARDFRVILHGRHGFVVDLEVERRVIVEKSSFFKDKLCQEKNVGVSFFNLDDCNDVEIYVEIIGLMYCFEMKPVLIKHGVPKVLRLLKVAQQLGFISCLHSCLEYLEAVPWGGQEEEEHVVTTLLRLGSDHTYISPVLRRVTHDTPPPPEEMLSHLLHLVLHSRDDPARRRDMKSFVLSLLKESNISTTTTIYTACEAPLKSLRLLFAEAAGDTTSALGSRISAETDNLLWLLEILVERGEAEGFAAEWSREKELSELYRTLPATVRHHLGRITVRLFVCVGKGEVVASEETRRMLVGTWLRPLMEDYGWVQHRQKLCERGGVEEGIGKTILTLPLEDQREAFVDWLGFFLKGGVGRGGGSGGCPNLQWAFGVWWRRALGVHGDCMVEL